MVQNKPFFEDFSNVSINTVQDLLNIQTQNTMYMKILGNKVFCIPIAASLTSAV